MEQLKVKKEKIKLRKSYLIWGASFIFLGLVISVWMILSWKNGFRVFFFPMMYIVFFIGFGYLFFFRGLFKLRKLINEFLNRNLVYFGSISYAIFTPLFLSGISLSIWCIDDSCKWHFSGLQIILISLGVTFLIISLISLLHEIRRIKGIYLENYLLENIKKENSLLPISRTLFKVRIEIISEDLEKTNYICGNCGEKNRFKSLNEKSGLLQCIKCGSENYLE